jgi:hypothetical protein
MGIKLSGEVGFIYLIDGRHDLERLREFTRDENPGFAIVAPAVRGYYSWPSERLVLGFREGGTVLRSP